MANATNSDKTGVSCYDGAGTFNGRTITAGTGISISNGNGVSGNPTVSADVVVATTYTADSGSATPASNNLNVFGGTGIDTSGATDTLTITAADAVPLTFTADSGSATPSGNNLNVVGSGGITTSGSGATLTIDGSGAGGGGWVLLETQTADGSASVLDFTTFSADYETYVFVINYIVGVSACSLRMLFSNDGGSNYQEDVNDYWWISGDDSATTGSPNSTKYAQINESTSISTSLGRGLNGMVWLYHPYTEFRNTTWTHSSQYLPSNSSLLKIAYGGGSYNTSETIDAVRFITTQQLIGGTPILTNIGQIRMYGITIT